MLGVLVPSPPGLSPCTLNPFLFRPLLAQEPALSPLPRGTASPSAPPAPPLLLAPAVPSPAATSSPSPPGCQFPLAAARALSWPLSVASGSAFPWLRKEGTQAPRWLRAGTESLCMRWLMGCLECSEVWGAWGCLFAPQGWRCLLVGLVAGWHLCIGGGIPLAWQWGHWELCGTRGRLWWG